MPTIVEPVRPAPLQRDLRTRAFAAFSCLWGVATLFHQAAHPARHMGLPMYVLTLAAIVLLMRPASLRRFLVLVLLQVGMVIYQLPHKASNHWVFTGFVALTVLLAFAGLAVRDRTFRVSRGDLLVAFAPAVRVQLLVLYFFAVLHKLNTDFLTPGVSCATDLMARIAYAVPGLPMGNWSDHLAIYGTLAVEAAIPILLAVRRTRLYGAMLGVAFHLSLIFDMRWVFYDFSSMIYALYFLFLIDLVLPALDRLREQGGSPARRLAWLGSASARTIFRRGLLALAGIVLLGGIYTLVTGHGPADHPRVLWFLRHIPRLPFLLYGALALSVLAVCWQQRHSPQEHGALFNLRPGAAATVVIALLVLNGLSPYIGLKTDNVFSMFSNLSTEGGRTNHLFMPAGLRVAGFQDDLVRVLESSHRSLQGLADRGELLPYFEFRDLARRAPGHSLTYVRAGATHTLDDIATSAELMTPTPVVLRKALQFRRVAGYGGPSPCRH